MAKPSVSRPASSDALTSIASRLGGTLVAITALVVIFAKDAIAIIGVVAVSLCVLGIFLGHYANAKR